MKFFTAFASAAVVSAIDFANLALIQAAQGNQGAGNLLNNPFVFASMLKDDSSSSDSSLLSDPLTLMALSGGNFGNLGGGNLDFLTLSLLDKTGSSDDSFSSLMALQAMNGGEFPKLNYWNKRK